ncbi:hypothetical protein GCM10011409_18860 [Lentibacillus populi]|uniref:Uncharacterized protein n=1 Tax=Lentibacillus populi TaxID=1827502 RepID=A0A9W5X5R2_9BACI|nr:hypothetical protein [Lentibacillus populi]GGB41567.1 hypothetical protein GCM10011409_18860 [Lentibacillus populi]
MKSIWYMAAGLLAILFLGIFTYVMTEFQDASETIKQQKKIEALGRK